MYSVVIDFIIFAAFVTVLGLVMVLTDKPPSGATKGDKCQVKTHQNNRRFRMARGDYHGH